MTVAIRLDHTKHPFYSLTCITIFPYLFYMEHISYMNFKNIVIYHSLWLDKFNKYDSQPLTENMFIINISFILNDIF